MRVIGIDPGGQTTGIVARVGPEYRGHRLVTRVDHPGWHDYLEAIQVTLAGIGIANADVIACESLNHPNPHLGLANVQGLMDTAQVIGALHLLLPYLVMVAPGGHGQHIEAAYPPELIGPNEPKLTGQLRHCRSAWDIAGVGQAIHAINQQRKL